METKYLKINPADNVVVAIVMEGGLLPGWIKAVVFFQKLAVAVVELQKIPVLGILFHGK